MSDRSLSYEDFSPRVGQSFTMRFDTDQGAATAELVLTSCERGPVRSMPGSFNLLFQAGPEAPREQGLYPLSRPDFEPTPIFLVPIRALAGGVEFHAVFNPSTEDENVP